MTIDLTVLSVDDKLALAQQLRAYDEAYSLHGCKFYRPHAKQDMFHREGGTKFRYLRTGNRFGKSDCGTCEDIAHALGARVWYPPSDPAYSVGLPKRPTKGLVLCTDWGKASEVFTNEVSGIAQGKFWRWLPRDHFVDRGTNHSGEINMLVVKSIYGGESTIMIDTVAGFMKNNQRAESGWFDWIHVDEPIPQAMWTAFSRGLIDSDGKAWFTCTPLREPWINNFFIPVPRFKLDRNAVNRFADPNTDQLNRAVIVGSSRDNPFVSESALDAFESGLSDRDKAARIEGDPIDASGVVHWPFKDEMIFREPPPGWSSLTNPPAEAMIGFHIDNHPRTPHAILFSATMPDGMTYFYDELWMTGDADDVGRAIASRIEGRFVRTALIDPSAFIDVQTHGSAFADDLCVHGVFVEKGSKDLDRAIMRTNELLRTNKLRFSCDLTRTLYEFETYVWDDPDKRPNKPRDKDDHMMEGLHRLCVVGFDYVSPSLYDYSVVPDRANSLLTI